MGVPQVEARRVLEQALGQAVYASLEALLPLEGPVCLAPDVSGSMESRLSRRRSTRYVDIAALFAAALVKRQGLRAHRLPFNHEVQPFPLVDGEPTADLAERLAGLCSGGTRLAACEELLAQGRISGHVGRGTFVLPQSGRSGATPVPLVAGGQDPGGWPPPGRPSAPGPGGRLGRQDTALGNLSGLPFRMLETRTGGPP